MARAVAEAQATLKPTFQLRICLGCGAAAAWRFDVKRRPYHYCGDCGLRFFVYHPKSMHGLSMLHGMVLRSGLQKFRQAVAQAEMRRSMRSPLGT